MKNNFTKIMQENLELNEDYKSSMNYYNTMYGYKRIKSQEEAEKELKAEEEKKKNEITAKEQQEEEEKIEEEISKYLDAYEKIQDDYEEYAYNIDSEISDLELEIKNETETDKIKKLQQKKNNLENKLKQYQRKAEFKLHSLNNKLSLNAKKELKERGDFHKDIDDVDLTESTIFNSSLSVLEEKFIFGNVLENIEDITFLEWDGETLDRINHEKVDATKAKQINNAAKTRGARFRDWQNAKPGAEKNAAKLELNQATNAQIQVGALMKEAENPIVAAKEKVIAKKELAIEKEQAAEQKDMERKREQLAKMKNQISAVKEKQQQVSSTQNQTPVDKSTVENLTEEISKEQKENDPVKNRIDFNNFSATLFNGGSGNALKYLLKGEINNGNITEIEIAKFMKDKPEVQTVIKKLKFYLRKTASGLSYEEYIDMKVQKGKFRTLFGDAKKEYMNRFKK